MATITLQQSFANYVQKPGYTGFEACMRDGELTDKIYKLADPIFETLQVAGKAVDIHPDAMNALAGARLGARATRDFAGMFAIFGGALRNIGSNLVNISRLVGELLSIKAQPALVELKMRKEVKVYPKGIERAEVRMRDGTTQAVNFPADVVEARYVTKLKYSEVAKDRVEMLWALGTEVGKLVANVAFVGAFGPSRVCANLIKFCNVETRNTYRVASWFPDFMLANHAASAFANGCEFFFLSRASNRAIQEGANRQTVQDDFDSKTKKIAVTILLKVLEIIHSVLGRLHRTHVIGKVPPIIHLPMALVIGVLSLYTVAIRITAEH